MTIDLHCDDLTVDQARAMSSDDLYERLEAIRTALNAGEWASEAGAGSTPAIYAVLWERRHVVSEAP